MDYTKKFIYQSNYWYNDGLKKANIRDMSGAIASLKKSLQYNRENIAARNLLGLIYYGRGEVVEALVEWIISKNFKAYENIADYYIKKVQETPSELETINQAIHKYNQCLGYCYQNGEDLAIIQLKKVITAHPSFLKAYQLLALLYLHTEQYAKARQILRRAHKMDITNDITLAYMHELTQVKNKKVAKLKEEKEQTVTYNLGNETIIQPIAESFKENAAVFTIVNIVVGIAVGAAVVWFLLAPAVNQKKVEENNKNIIALSEEMAAKDTQIETLKKELESYRNTNDEAKDAVQTAQKTQQSYEALFKVSAQYEGGVTSYAQMLEVLLTIDRDALGEDGKKMYDEISSDVFPTMCERLYEEAQSSMEEENYDAAVSNLEKVVQMDADYSDGMAMKLLGDAYVGNGEVNKAREIYEKVVENYTGTQAAEDAQSALTDSTDPEQGAGSPQSSETTEEQ